MKIFNFDKGVKGEMLGESNLPQSSGSCLRKVDTGEYVHLVVDGKSFHENSFERFSNKEIKPEDFNTEAICFCTGKYQDDKWHWEFLATDKWLKENGYLNGHYLNRHKEGK